MKTFHWVETEENGYVDLECYYTRYDRMGKTYRHMVAFAALPEDVKEAKLCFEKARKRVIVGGAWEPREGAMWHYRNNKWVMDGSDIRLLGVA